MSSRISSLGSNLLIVSPGSSTTGGVRGGFGSASTLTADDAAALASAVAAPDIAAVAPEKSTSQELDANSTNWTTTVTGTTVSWPAVRSRTLAEGAFFTQADVDSQALVAVLGPETATELFGTTRVVGQSVTISGKTVKIVGVLASAGSNSTSNLDDAAIMPLTTVANVIVGGSSSASVNTVYIQAASGDALSGAYQEAQAILLQRHGATSSTSADFTISSQDALVETATSVTKTLTVLLTGVAALSLLVGGSAS